MAQAFNLTAQLNLRGPRNVTAIVSRINRQLGNINANVNLNINRNTQTAINNVNAALTNLNGTLATTATNAGNVTAAINNLTGALTAMGNLNVNQQLNNAANAVRQLGNNAGNAAAGGGGAGGGVQGLRTELEEFGRQSALAVRRFAAFSLVTSVIFGLSNAFNKAFKSFVDFDKEFVRLQQVTGESANGLRSLSTTITSLAANLGVSSAELVTVSSTLAQAGLTARDTEKALKALALSALAPSFDSMNDTVEGSIALMRQFSISAEQLESALGSVNAVAAAFAVEAGDIIAAIQRTGGVFASASKGVSEGTDALNEFIAVFTSVRQTTRESAETIATGLRTIFTRIQRSSTIEALKEFNVNLTDAEGKFVGAYKAIELLSRGLNSIDPRDLKFSEIVEELGGFRQIGKVIPLIQQFDTAQRALAVAQAGQTSLTEDAAVAQLSLANQFAKVREEFLAMVREIGGTDTFQTLVKGALALASGLIKLADSAKSVLPVIAAITAFRGLGAARQFGRGFLGGIRGGAAQGNANGGMIRAYQNGGMVPVALMPGETVVYPDTVSEIGVPTLRQLNHADKKMARGGGVGLVPGTGRTDSFYTSLPEGSFVIRTDATRALGGPKGVLSAGSNVQKFKQGTSKRVKKRPNELRDEEGRTREEFYADMVSKRRRPIVDEEGRTREEFYADMVRGPLDDINRAKRRKFAVGGMTLKSITSSGAQGAPTLRALMVKDQDDAFRTGKAINASDNFGQPYTTELYSSNKIGKLVKRHYQTLQDRARIIDTLTLQTQQTARGTAFEDLLQQSGVAGRRAFYQSPLDFVSRNSAAEAKWQTGAVSTATMISKSIRQKLADNKFRSLKDVRQKPPSPETNQVFPKLYNRLTLHKRSGKFDPRIAKKAAGIIDDEKQQDKQPQKNAARSVAKAKLKPSAFGGIIQKFKTGSSKPLESMGRSDLIDAAKRLGVGYSYQDLGNRGEIGAQARAKLIQELESKRQIQRIGEQQSAARAAERQVAVIGLAASEGIRGSSEQVKLPGLKEAGKTQRDLDATLNIGALEGKVSQRTQATLRNSAIRGSMKAAKIMAQAAGESASLQSLQQQVALRQKLKSVPSEMMGFGFQSSILGLQGQMTPSGSADLAGGLSKPYADLFGVPANVPTDITLGGTEGDRLREEAKRKATGTRQSKRGRSGSQFRRAFTGKAFGGILKLAFGDMAKANPATDAPLIDDIIGSIPGTYPPVPSGTKLTPALEKIIAAGGGLLDYDGTLMKHTGDEAYARAKTPQEKEAVLAKYYRSEKDRLASGRPTKFARELQKAIEQGLIKPANLSVVSMSKRLPIVEQDIMRRFGIPKDNLIFTQGGSKAKAVEAFRTKGPRASRVSRASGGDIPILAQEGEYVINRRSASAIGYGNLDTLNKYHTGGKVQKFAMGGQPDTIGSTFSGFGTSTIGTKAFGLLEKTVFALRDRFRGVGNEAQQTTQAFGIIRRVSTDLVDDIRSNAMANNRTATSQGKVATEYAKRIQALQAQGATDAQIKSAVQRWMRSLQADTNAKDQAAIASLRNRGQGLGLGQRMQLAGAKKISSGGFISSTIGEAQIGIGKAVAGVNSALTSLRTSLTRSGSSFGSVLNSATTGVTNYTKSIIQAPGLFSKLSATLSPLTSALRTATTTALRFGRRPAIPQNPFATMGGTMGAAAQATQQAAGGGGRGGRGGRGGGGLGMGLMFGIPMIADMLAGGEPTSADQARQQAVTTSTATGAGIGAMFGPIGMIVGALGGFGLGLMNAQKAVNKFTIDKAKATIEDNGEKISRVLEDISKIGKATPLQLAELNKALASSVDASLAASEAMKPKRGFGQMATEALTSAYLGGEVSMEGSGSQMARSAIYEKQGFMGLIRAQLGGAGTEQQMFQDIAPAIARETSKAFASVAAQARGVFEQQFKSGQSIEDIINTPAWTKQSEVLARSNAAIQEQLLLIEANSALSDREKEARSRSLIATEAETQLRKQFAEIKAAEDLKKLQSAINRVSFSFNRMLGNMDSSIQRSVDNLEKFNNSVSLASASAAGQAKVGSGGVQDIINVLKNPQAYGGAERSAAFSAAASSFGSQSGNIQSILSASAGLESTILGTINRTLTGSKGETDEAVAGKITSTIKDQLRNLQIPPAIADKLSQQIGAAVGKLRRQGEDTVDFTQLVETVPEIAKSIDIFKNTADQASKALEFNKKAFDTLADATNQYIDLIVESNGRLRAAQSIIAKGSMDLKRALGGNVSLGERRAAIEAPIRSMTGGATDPAAIAANQRRLEADRARLQAGRDQAARSQDVGAVRAFDNQLAQTSISLRENVAALKQMADSSELASAALEEIDKAQKKQQAGIGIMEKLVTSTPKDLSKMNQAFARLDANMRGVAIGGTSPEQRKETLDMFQMIAPFLGDQEKGLQANVLQSMLMESGVGINPMMQQILDSMRNPQMDPQQATAIATYQQAIDTQARANEQLAIINQNLAEAISKKTGDAVAAAIANTSIRFEDKQLNDLLSKINVVPTPSNPAATLATGGIVYKALGGNIDRTIFKPKGTDTVPAMLTPGEFVVNRQATQSNLPLLKSINNGYSRGGQVKYLASGGFVSNILKPTASAVNTVTTGISTEALPALNPTLVPSSEKSSYLSAGKANVFAGLGGPEGADKNLVSALLDIKRLTQAGEAKGNQGGVFGSAITTYPDYFDKSGSNEFASIKNKALNLTSAKPILGLAPNIKLENIARSMWYDYLIPTATQFSDLSGVFELTAMKQIPFASEEVKKLTASTTIDPIKSMKLNNRGVSAGGVTLDKYAALSDISADSLAANAGTQLTLMDDVLLYLNDGYIKNIDKLKESLVFPDSTINPGNFGLPKTVGNTYKNGIVSLSQSISGMMYPTITSKKDSSVNLPKATTTFPSPSDFSWGMYKPTVYGAGKSGGYEIPSNVGFPQIDKTSIDNMISSLSGYRENIIKARDELSRKSKIPKMFSGTTDVQKQYSNISASLGKVYSGNISGLYETINIDSNELNDKWKSLIDNPLHIFNNRNITAPQWNDAITRAKSNTDVSFKNSFSKLKGYDINGGEPPISIYPSTATAGPSYPWLSGNKDIVQTFVDKYFKAQQTAAEEAYQSPFKIGEETKNHIFDTGIPLANLDPGLGKGTLKAAFGYRDIESMPLLSPNNGYNLAGSVPLNRGVLIESGPASITADQTIADVLKLPEGQIGIDTNITTLQNKITKALADYINKPNVAASIAGLQQAKRISTTDAGWIAPQEKNAFGILGQLDPIQIDEAVRNFKNNSLITGGGQANRIVGAQISPIGDPLATSVAILQGVLGPTAGVLQRFGYGLYPLTAAAQIGPYAEGLMSLSKQFGQKIVNPQNGKVDPILSNTWGRITAVGETLGLIAKNDIATLSRKIGLSQAFAGSQTGGVLPLANQVLQYANFLGAQGQLGAGITGQGKNILQSTIGGDQMIATTGGKPGQAQSLNDIFQGATEATVGQDGKISSTQSAPPKTLLEIGKKALNPYNTFANPADRTSLLDYISGQLRGQVNDVFFNNLKVLRDYLNMQDQVLAAKDPALAMNTYSKALTSNYTNANRSLLAFTNGEFGQLPDTQKILELAAFRKSQQQAQKEEDKKAKQMSTGGVVYASTGTLVNYQPRGTDTVPAMLTPGEFVVNRSSTQKHLPLLRAINSGSNNLSSIASSFNSGGLVNYLQNGGVILPKYYDVGSSGVVAGGGTASGMPKVALDASKAGQQITDALTTGTNALTQILRTFGFDSNQLNAISGFINGLKTVTDALANVNITPTVKFEMAPVQVNITGASNLTQAAESIVNGAIQKWFTDFLDKNQQANMVPPSQLNK